MKSTMVFRSLMGSVIVYITMAACVATENNPVATTGTGGSSGMGNGGFGGFVDAMVDPVPDANADTSGSGTRLKRRYYAGEDGSRQDLGWWDVARSEQCQFRQDNVGKYRCMPPLGATAFYMDDQCSVVIASPTYNAPCGQPYNYINIVTQVDQCTYGSDIHAFGVQTTPTWVRFKKADGSCVIFSGLESTVTDWHTLGTKVPASTFVAATIATDL